MRLLDLSENKLRVRIDCYGEGAPRKLTVQYPDDPYYRERIMRALADILRPEPDDPTKPKPEARG